METVVRVGNISFLSSVVFGVSSNIAVTAKLAGEMRTLSHENIGVPTVVSLWYWNDI